MKKKILAAASLLLPVCFLCACGGTIAVPVTAYWYKDSSSTNMLGENREERLTYEVTFEPSSSATGLTLAYRTGTYTTYLSATSKDDDGAPFGSTVYRYETELRISGAYSVNGEKGSDFDDSVHSVVYFKGIENSLRPVKSEKTVLCHAPNSAYTSTENCFLEFNYNYTVTYDEDGEKATAVYTQFAPEQSEGQPFAPETQEVNIKDPTNFYDNEQLLFVMRGISMDAVFSLKTINPLTKQLSAVKILEAPALVKEADFALEIGGTDTTNNIDAYRFALQYESTTPGQAQTLTYAKTTDKSNNRYRNVLLRMSVPVLSNLGTLNYKLVSADFAD